MFFVKLNGMLSSCSEDDMMSSEGVDVYLWV